MLPIVHEAIEKYLEQVRPASDAVLRDMEALAAENDFPIVGPDVGRLLFALARFGGARRVLELGSGFGYSGYWFAQALPADGEVHCTDTRAENQRRATEYFARAALSEKLHFHLGEALEVARGLDGPFDIIFNDIDKEDYVASIDVASSVLREGGLLITDNALWHGQVAEADPDGATRGVLEFNRRMAAHPEFSTVVLPLRDGVSVAVKIRTIG